MIISPHLCLHRSISSFCHLPTSMSMYVRPPSSAPILPISLCFAISYLRVTSLSIAHLFVCHDHQSTSASISVHFNFCHLSTSMSMYVHPPSSASISVHLSTCISDKQGLELRRLAFDYSLSWHMSFESFQRLSESLCILRLLRIETFFSLPAFDSSIFLLHLSALPHDRPYDPGQDQPTIELGYLLRLQRLTIRLEILDSPVTF